MTANQIITEPDHCTNNSVYADYSSQLSLSDFLYVAEPSLLSLALTAGTKQQPVIIRLHSDYGPERPGAARAYRLLFKLSFNTSYYPQIQFLCVSALLHCIYWKTTSEVSFSESAIKVWIYICEDQLKNGLIIHQLCHKPVRMSKYSGWV